MIDTDLYLHSGDLHTVGIDRQMKLSPGPALTLPVLTHLPFTLTLHHPVRQTEQPFHGQQRLNGHIGVAKGHPPAALRRGGIIARARPLIEPQGQVTPLHYGSIVLRPVGYPILFFGLIGGGRLRGSGHASLS